ncbi:HAAS signaling domain-containing protein [Microbacterium alcoholitolerans]|uniref:HAAS signaling domain-containing protein n=1 Tax=unclassified Microbacterium TaxID=2609290 RepID=UPI003D16CE7F
MSTEDTYLRSVERMLRDIAPEHRTAVLDDLREHFADAADAGQPVDETIRGLGTPRTIAERAHEEFGVASAESDARAERAWRVLQGAAVVMAVVTGVVVAFIMPSFATDEGLKTLFEMQGLWPALIALVPALITVVPLAVGRAARTPVTIICAGLVTALALIGGFTIGGFFLPSVLLSWAALVAWVRLRGSGFGIGWRIAGGVLAALPVLSFLIPVFGGMPGRYADDPVGPSVGIDSWGWVLLAGVLALAALIVVGFRAAGWALTAIGLFVLIVGLVSGGLLTLLFVWLGGLWLTIGLTHAVTAARRR